MTEDDKQAKRDALQAQLSEGIDSLVTSDEWSRYLDVQSKFHHYSFGNTLLIMLQCPDATRVASYKKWQELDRQVRKGEHGISIWCPVTRMVEATDKDGNPILRDGKPYKREQLVGWRVGSTFDIAQTDGEELPEVIHLLTGEDEQGLYDRLVKVASRIGFTVQDGDTGSANGITMFDPDVITIHPDRSPCQRVKTLAHEIGHALMHRDVDYGACRGLYELQAESVAYVVTGCLGLDTSGYSFGYVARWSDGDADKARDLIKSSGEQIQKAAKRILDELDS